MLGLSVSRWVEAHDGTQLHAVVTRPGGKRRPRAAVVLIHGFTMATPFWSQQLEDLGQDHLVITYDQRGHGRSGAAQGTGFSLETLGADLDAVVRALVPPDLAAVAAGHSMGGMAIMGWAAHTAGNPGARGLHGAVLCNTTAHNVAGGLVRQIPPWISGPLLGSLVPLITMPVRLEGPALPVLRTAMRVMAFGRGASESDRIRTEHLLRATHPVARSKAARFLWSMDARDALDHLTVPTTVVVGEQDRLTPAARGREIADHLGARLVVLPDAGHQGPMEAPGTVNRVIRSVVDDVLRG
ncbi:alpha/beta fold hydrolase [Paraconexibacter sp.]|uniref:alpha/beta fold hydrolase n=1 Tax=Paraconexibacter sp. TaxID=2949640 RepID=UPI003565A6DD